VVVKRGIRLEGVVFRADQRVGRVGMVQVVAMGRVDE
jgi:hypothetical protein